MRFAIDASNLTGSKTGLDFMTEGIIQGFRSFPEHELLVYTTNGYVGELGKNWIKIDKPIGFAAGIQWYRKATEDMRRREVDVFISTWTFTAAALFPKTIQIVPDLSPIFFPGMFNHKQAILFRLTLKLALNRGWKVVAISQSVANEIKQTFPWYKREIGVMPLSINEWALLPQTEQNQKQQVRSKYGLGEKYFLSVSTIQPRKNYLGMIKAFAEFSKSHPDFQYAIVGKKGWKFDEIFTEVEKLNLKEKVKFLDYTPDLDLPALVDGAAGFLYASVYEGFGIPPLNAAYRGIPVLVSDIPVFHEILSDTEAVFVNAKDVDSMKQGMENILTKQLEFGNQKLVEGFNWKNCAAKLIEVASI